MEETLAGAVGVPGVGDGGEDCENPGWRGEEEGGGGVVAESGGDGGKEVAEGETHDCEEVEQGEEPDFGVGEGEFEALKGREIRLLVCGRRACIFGEARLGDG